MSTQAIQPGKFVTLTYSITDAEGSLLEQNDLPVSYIHNGETELIGGMDEAVLGKKPGDTVKMTVPPDKAFGTHDPNLTYTDELANVPAQLRRVGAEVQMQNEAGEVKNFIVTGIENGKLTVDGNHPLAGKTLQVSVKILEVRDATDADVIQIAALGNTPPTIN